MNVYDFDGTIYYPNCTFDFAIWCTIRHPKLLITYFPKIAWNVVLYKLGKIPLHRLIRKLYENIGKIDDFEKQVELFWDKNENKVAQWYLDQKKDDDLIISTSASFLIAPIAKRLGVEYVATEVDPETGVYVDNLMYAKGKARYIIDRDFPVIENFYSDSLSDTPIALCADNAYLVVNRARTIVNWPHLDEATMKKVKSKIITGWTIHL